MLIRQKVKLVTDLQ